MRQIQRVFAVSTAIIGIVLFPFCDAHKIDPNQIRSGTIDQRGIVVEKLGPITLNKAQVTRDTNPAITAPELMQVAEGNTAFAVAMYKKLAGENENMVFSPYSISVALGMTWGGARGKTGKEIAQTLHFPFAQDKQHAGMNALDLLLKAHAKSSGFELNIVNQLWGDQKYFFLPDYLKLISRNYGAGIQQLDFRNQPEPSRILINKWVSEQTRDRIGDLIPPGGIIDAAKLVLTNAVYFKAKWADSFNAMNTYSGMFYRATSGFIPEESRYNGKSDQPHGIVPQSELDQVLCGPSGNSVSARFMSRTSLFAAVKTLYFQAVRLPYKGNTMSMVIIMPKPGRMKLIEDSLSPAFLTSAINLLKAQEIRLCLPKFKFTTKSMKLTSFLESLGMQLPFIPAADFSGIDGNKGLFIFDIFHKAIIAVDEKETEAAAATAVVMGKTGGSVPDPTPVYAFDHPFIFLIQDNKTGTVLFMGKINDPERTE